VGGELGDINKRGDGKVKGDKGRERTTLETES